MNWTKILNYYLDSSTYFTGQMLDFFEYMKGNCECQGESYVFKSQVYLDYKKREKENGGRLHYLIGLSEKQAEKYFSSNYSDEQLFTIIFAHWWELPAEQIKTLAKKSVKKYCSILLEFFLAGGFTKDAEVILSLKVSTDKKIKLLQSNINQAYTIYGPNGNVPAELGLDDENYSVLVDYTGKVYNLNPYPFSE